MIYYHQLDSHSLLCMHCRTGVIMDSLNGVHDMKVVTGHLPKGVTWDEIDVLSVWYDALPLQLISSKFISVD